MEPSGADLSPLRQAPSDRAAWTDDVGALVIGGDYQGLGIVRRRDPGASPAPAGGATAAAEVAGRRWDEAAIAALGYEDLDRDRAALLDLRPPAALDDVLAAIGPASNRA